MRIFVKDLNCILSLVPNRTPVLKSGVVGEAHIAAYGEALLDWFEGRFGTDTFFVGGTFDIESPDLKPVHRHLLAGMLDENGFSPRNLIKMLVSRGGFEFLANRREELWTIAMSGGIRVGFRT